MTMTFHPNRPRVHVEEAREYDGHRDCDPRSAPTKGCIVCDEVDNLSCARGVHCAAARPHGLGAPIGYYLDVHPETGYDVGRESDAWEYPTLPGVLFCEDCVSDIDSGGGFIDDPVLSGTVSQFHWAVNVDNSERDRFYASVVTVDATHAISWEREVGSFATLGAAVVHARSEAERLDVIELDAEWASGIHWPEAP
jgi:hypothetical protein